MQGYVPEKVSLRLKRAKLPASALLKRQLTGIAERDDESQDVDEMDCGLSEVSSRFADSTETLCLLNKMPLDYLRDRYERVASQHDRFLVYVRNREACSSDPLETLLYPNTTHPEPSFFTEDLLFQHIRNILRQMRIPLNEFSQSTSLDLGTFLYQWRDHEDKISAKPEALFYFSQLLYAILKTYYLYARHEDFVIEGTVSLGYKLHRFKGLSGLEDCQLAVLASALANISSMLSRQLTIPFEQKAMLQYHALYAKHLLISHLSAVQFNEYESLSLEKRLAPLHHLAQLVSELVFQGLSQSKKVEIQLILESALDTLYHEGLLSALERYLFSETEKTDIDAIHYAQLLLYLGLAALEMETGFANAVSNQSEYYLQIASTLCDGLIKAQASEALSLCKEAILGKKTELALAIEESRPKMPATHTLMAASRSEHRKLRSSAAFNFKRMLHD